MPYIQRILDGLKQTSPAQPEFYQAVQEVLATIKPLIDSDPKYLKHGVLDRLVEPERQIMFRVAWLDDKGDVQVNKGYRIQFNAARSCASRSGCRTSASCSRRSRTARSSLPAST